MPPLSRVPTRRRKISNRIKVIVLQSTNLQTHTTSSSSPWPLRASSSLSTRRRRRPRRLLLLYPQSTPREKKLSTTGAKGLGIPQCIIHEAEGLVVTVETKAGELYRGMLTASEDNMNLHMRNVQYTSAEGETKKLTRVFLRGSQIRFVALPEMLSASPVFTRVQKFKASKGRYIPTGGGVAAIKSTATTNAIAAASTSVTIIAPKEFNLAPGPYAQGGRPPPAASIPPPQFQHQPQQQQGNWGRGPNPSQYPTF